MEKVIRDGKVAVLYSPGYGAGWSRQCWDEKDREILVFHPLLVEMVESGRESLITDEWMKEHFGEELGYIYCGGAEQLEIEWLPVGTRFVIDEYDGFETIHVLDDIKFMTA